MADTKHQTHPTQQGEVMSFSALNLLGCCAKSAMLYMLYNIESYVVLIMN